MYRIATACLIVLLSLSTPPITAAQQGSDDENWYRVFRAKFEPGRAQEGIAFIKKHFSPIDEQIGRKVLSFEFLTGEWTW